MVFNLSPLLNGGIASELVCDRRFDLRFASPLPFRFSHTFSLLGTPKQDVLFFLGLHGLRGIVDGSGYEHKLFPSGFYELSYLDKFV